VRIFADANVVFSALSTHGVCFELLELCLSEHEVLVSEQVLEETARTLVKVTRYSRKEADSIVAGFAHNVTICPPYVYEEISVRDPDDVEIFGAARFAQADILVTGDKDLLVLHAVTEMDILRPRELLDLLKGDVLP
jgi:uncharacterized protein